jgi:hypothetical protein
LRTNEIEAFSDDTITVDIDGHGIVHMGIPSGGGSVSMAFPVNQLIKNMLVCEAAIAKWHLRTLARPKAEVVQLIRA